MRPEHRIHGISHTMAALVYVVRSGRLSYADAEAIVASLAKLYDATTTSHAELFNLCRESSLEVDLYVDKRPRATRVCHHSAWLRRRAEDGLDLKQGNDLGLYKIQNLEMRTSEVPSLNRLGSTFVWAVAREVCQNCGWIAQYHVPVSGQRLSTKQPRRFTSSICAGRILLTPAAAVLHPCAVRCVADAPQSEHWEYQPFPSIRNHLFQLSLNIACVNWR
jgi:hypothetical protein